MPRQSTLRVRALAELARQLRFESKDAARRQLERAETLAMELLEAGADAPGAYPEEWVVFRITGLRSDSALGGGEAGMIVREALIGDLGALIERLSSAAAMSAEDFPAKVGKGGAGGKIGGPWLGVEEVCKRWKVSRKTVERLRRRGLIGRRAAMGKGKERVVFAESVLKVLERLRGEELGGAAKFTRIPTSERAKMIEEAHAMRAEEGWTLDRCARVIARAHGRAPETVRQMLRKHDEQAAEPVFHERGPLTAHEKGVVENAAVRGGKITKAAARLSRGRATVYRVLNDRRAARLRELDLSGPVAVGGLFEREDAASVLLSSESVREGLGGAGYADAASVIAEAAAMGPVNAKEEAARAKAYWFLRWRAARGVAMLAKHGARVGAKSKRGDSVGGGLDEIEKDLVWASRVKAELMRSQLPLLLRTVESRIGHDLGELVIPAANEVVREGIAAIVEAVERFDPFKGGRLAAPAGVALGRVVGAWMKRREEAQGGTGGTPVPLGRPPVRATARRMVQVEAPEDWTRHVNVWQSWLDLDRAAVERIGKLKERERRVVELRYGLDGASPQTIADVAREMKTTATRVAAVQRKILARVRAIGPG